VTLVEPARDVRQHVDAEGPEREDHRRKTGEAVRVEVAEHHHPLASGARLHETLAGHVGIGQEPRVVQAGVRLAEPPVEVSRLGHPARGEDPGDAIRQLVTACRGKELNGE
jgi:hypothetical protein